MASKEQLIKAIEGLSSDLIEEVHDFIAFVQKRRGSKSEEGRIMGQLFAEHRGLRLLERSGGGRILLRGS